TGAGRELFENWLYDGLLIGAAALVLLRGVLVARERLAWLVLGVGLAAWASGVVEATVHTELASGCFPSSVDVVMLAPCTAGLRGAVLLAPRSVVAVVSAFGPLGARDAAGLAVARVRRAAGDRRVGAARTVGRDPPERSAAACAAGALRRQRARAAARQPRAP